LTVDIGSVKSSIMIHTKTPLLLTIFLTERYVASLTDENKYFYYLEGARMSVNAISNLVKDSWETTLNGLSRKEVTMECMISYGITFGNVITSVKGLPMAYIHYSPYCEIRKNEIFPIVGVMSGCVLIYEVDLPFGIFVVRRIAKSICGCL